jgi:hypothetical protein
LGLGFFLFNKCTAPRAFLHFDSFEDLLQVAGRGQILSSLVHSMNSKICSMGRAGGLGVQAVSGNPECHLAEN